MYYLIKCFKTKLSCQCLHIDSNLPSIFLEHVMYESYYDLVINTKINKWWKNDIFHFILLLLWLLLFICKFNISTLLNIYFTNTTKDNNQNKVIMMFWST